MKRFYFIIISLLVVIHASSQTDTSIRLLKTIKGDYFGFTVDNLNNIYLLTNTDQLKKLNAEGDSLAVYNNVTKYGKVSYIDVSNPMRTLLYYKDFATVVTLDRLLNVRNTIELRKHNILQVQAVGLAYDNSIWLYDEIENKLKKIGEDGNLILETVDFRQLFDQPPVPTSIYDQEGLVYLYDQSRGVYIFDYYGAFKSKVPYSGLSNFKVVGKVLSGMKNDSIIAYHTSLFHELRKGLPVFFREAKAINFGPQRGYALRNDGLDIYLIAK